MLIVYLGIRSQVAACYHCQCKNGPTVVQHSSCCHKIGNAIINSKKASVLHGFPYWRITPRSRRVAIDNALNTCDTPEAAVSSPVVSVTVSSVAVDPDADGEGDGDGDDEGSAKSAWIT
eukprot:gnl/MRDRNA2_/MRDRNA2_15154_c0_seq1.p1 gnl/MRDRNA2_/MRDRNA2_15154_c0~~gnl/MRDRNA2_/MRDRNA2_15154_c0_seq1.p1  ORF type:complete len:119 (+),score=15.57 gnl/MRDRNA2_/MRDRNA2_15154_c0_seq1:181-537(+)